MRLRVGGPRTRRYYYYPDAMVVCDQELSQGDDDMHITRPCVIVEIVSRDSARNDHTEKLQVCRALPSVQAYVIVHQQPRRIERHWRDDGEDAWQVEVISSGSLRIPCIGRDLALDEIYAGL
jgi:Uma2 family endonuclease